MAMYNYGSIVCKQANLGIDADGGGVGSFHSRSWEKAALNLPEHSSAIPSFLGMLSNCLTVYQY
jgi:hypothetical protein